LVLPQIIYPLDTAITFIAFTVTYCAYICYPFQTSLGMRGKLEVKRINNTAAFMYLLFWFKFGAAAILFGKIPKNFRL
jgi:hypothetical protein